MKQIILSLVMLAAMPAFGAIVICEQGQAGKSGYQEIKVISEVPLEEMENTGTKVEVVITQVVRLGRNRVTTVTTPLKGEVIADFRTMTRPDPATVINLLGENESGQTQYGVLYARESLASLQSMEMNRADGETLRIDCQP